MLLQYWIDFITSNNLVDREMSISELNDQSGVGAEFGFLTEEQSVDEATNFWPGIGVFGDGFVPVCECLIGSGDYYYINMRDGSDGPLYRIYHDTVHEDGYDAKQAITVVLSNYNDILLHAQS